MFRRGPLVLLVTLALFGWAMLELFQNRFESGDLYPMGSSYRSDALGTRAIADAISEGLPRDVERYRGRKGQLAKATNATILVSQLSFWQLVAKKDPLIEELTQAAIGGARVIVALSDRESATCRKTYCNEESPTRCHANPSQLELADSKVKPQSSAKPQPSEAPVPAVAPAGSRVPVKEAEADYGCGDAALGTWGFDIGGTRDLKVFAATLQTQKPSKLPKAAPLHSPAKFIQLSPEFEIIYARGNDPVIIERSLGKGSLVLMSEGYLLSNEAQRDARFPELLLWLLGANSRVIFEESHLGVMEPRGVMTLMRELKLQGFLIGVSVFALLFAWQRLKPLSPHKLRRRAKIGNQSVGDSTLLALLRRSLTPKLALHACIEEAKLAKIGAVVEGASRAKSAANVEGFNRVFCSEQERSDSK